MSETGTLATLAGVLALSVVSPGPNFVLVTSTAMRASRRAGLAVAAGLALATLTWVLLTEAGFALLLAPGTIAAEIVRVSGAAYLIFIGIKMVSGARKPMPQAPVAAPQGIWTALRKGYLVSMTSPKSIAFYASILGALMPAEAPVWFDASVVAIAVSVSVLWYGSLAIAFSDARVRRGFARVKTGVESVMGLCLVALGGRLLAST
ncbi:MAG: LysE family translocator [Janthinobacterium lividum]